MLLLVILFKQTNIFPEEEFNNKKQSKDARKYGHGLGNPLFIAERFGFYFRHFQQHYKINIFNQKIVKNDKTDIQSKFFFFNDKLTKTIGKTSTNKI